jgi:hypothetical protein
MLRSAHQHRGCTRGRAEPVLVQHPDRGVRYDRPSACLVTPRCSRPDDGPEQRSQPCSSYHSSRGWQFLPLYLSQSAQQSAVSASTSRRSVPLLPRWSRDPPGWSSTAA